jgi:hypothetical protein
VRCNGRGHDPRLLGGLLAVFAASACRRSEATSPTDAAPGQDERRARLLAALTAVEQSSGEARDEAHWRFYDPRSFVVVAPDDADLLPRFEALLDSADGGDIDLGLHLVCHVRQARSLPKVWNILKHRRGLLRGKAIDCIAFDFHDDTLVPVLRDIIARDDEDRGDAIRALRSFVKDPAAASRSPTMLPPRG